MEYLNIAARDGDRLPGPELHWHPTVSTAPTRFGVRR
jgi:hypothetical protein